VKIISFSLWGSIPKYSDGALINVKEARDIYPGWICRFYYDSSVPIESINSLIDAGAEVIKIDSRGEWDGLFWRFLAMDEPLAEVVIVRDTDSVVSSRESAAVKEWLESEFLIHAMRDHVEHNVPIMGGMWGVKNPSVLFGGRVEKIIKRYDTHSPKKGLDQDWLASWLWGKHREDAIVHDRYTEGFFCLPDKTIKHRSEVVYYNKFDNCGDDNFLDYPRGKIEFKDGQTFQRLDVYAYDPIEFFGKHEIRNFPHHDTMKYGTYVGEIL